MLSYFKQHVPFVQEHEEEEWHYYSLVRGSLTVCSFGSFNAETFSSFNAKTFNEKTRKLSAENSSKLSSLLQHWLDGCLLFEAAAGESSTVWKGMKIWTKLIFVKTLIKNTYEEISIGVVKLKFMTQIKKRMNQQFELFQDLVECDCKKTVGYIKVVSSTCSMRAVRPHYSCRVQTLDNSAAS